jgi:hypothetical protein
MKIFRAMAIIPLAALAGCATYDRTKAPPAEAGPISVQYSSTGASGWSDLPMGAYQVPNSDVVISGHQKGGGFGMLFGAAGVLAESAVEAHQGKSAVSGAQDALHIDLASQADRLTKDALASGRFGGAFTATADANGAALQVDPYTVLTFVNDSDVQPYVVLKASLKGGWSTRYISSVGAPLALAGDGSLTANGGERLKAVLDTELKHAVDAMLDDVARPRARDENKLLYVETGVPFVRWHMGVVGYELSDDGQTLVYAPKIADAVVFSGVYVVDKSSVTIRPATPKDKTVMLDDGK